jgi:excisionase family DNA binding protein
MNPEPWLTLPEIAKHLKLSKETLYRMIYKKQIPFLKIGKCYRFKASEVDRYFLGEKITFKHVAFDEVLDLDAMKKATEDMVTKGTGIIRVSTNDKKKKVKTTKKPRMTFAEIDKINLLWHLNGRNISSIGKIMRKAPQTCERVIFPTRAEWEKWSDEFTKGGT